MSGRRGRVPADVGRRAWGARTKNPVHRHHWQPRALSLCSPDRNLQWLPPLRGWMIQAHRWYQVFEWCVLCPHTCPDPARSASSPPPALPLALSTPPASAGPPARQGQAKLGANVGVLKCLECSSPGYCSHLGGGAWSDAASSDGPSQLYVPPPSPCPFSLFP